ncbi:hypothetical protein [Endozoicomonas sp. ONNA2]|uniref:hypothetical protein n=1 Tax=Endozoicomonas sp. ONNA2 TaxID=2828741 RepID=UPI002147FF76|nr:hypothetical protein [Endozoicomonas sp. ONNA2]
MPITTNPAIASQPKAAPHADKSAVSASPENWLTRALNCAYETACALPNITRMIVSSPGKAIIFLTLAGRCISPVRASPHSPSSASTVTPSTSGLDPSVYVPFEPPFIPPRETEPEWMGLVESGHPANGGHDRSRPATSAQGYSQPGMETDTRPENRCVDKSLLPFYSGPRISLACPGKMLPLDQSRNVRQEYLQCAKAGYSWTRYPDSLDEAAWHAMKKTDPDRAVQWLRDLPAP